MSSKLSFDIYNLNNILKLLCPTIKEHRINYYSINNNLKNTKLLLLFFKKIISFCVLLGNFSNIFKLYVYIF